MAKSARIAILLMALAGVARAESDTFSIAGVAVGDPVDAAFVHRHCPANTANRAYQLCSKSIDMDGKDVRAIYYILDGRVATISLRYPPELWDEVRAIMAEKIGRAPDEEQTVPVRTRMGATYENRKAIWKTAFGTLTVSRFGGSISRGAAHLDSPGLHDWLARKKADETGALRDRL